MKNKFGIGDKVRVVSCEYNEYTNVIGKVGLVDGVDIGEDYITYSVDGIPEMHAWYHEEQLEMINKNPNR